ncbi:hypothetical protein AOLI_G00192180 [Acnodon oligacanthus]
MSIRNTISFHVQHRSWLLEGFQNGNTAEELHNQNREVEASENIKRHVRKCKHYSKAANQHTRTESDQTSQPIPHWSNLEEDDRVEHGHVMYRTGAALKKQASGHEDSKRKPHWLEKTEVKVYRTEDIQRCEEGKEDFGDTLTQSENRIQSSSSSEEEN